VNIDTRSRPPDTLLDSYRPSSDDVATINIVADSDDVATINIVTESTLIPDLVHLIHCWITTDPAQTTVNIDTRSRPPDTLLDSYRPSSDDVATINIVTESTLIPDILRRRCRYQYCHRVNIDTRSRPPDTLLDNYRPSSDDVATINIVAESTLIPDL
ncbi:hypothetical protein J6590_107605, partial [Homalodisca vitripennis]